MREAGAGGKTIRFQEYEVDVSAGQLRRQGRKVRLRDQSFKVLVLLLEHAGEVVTREELRRRLWPEDIFVDFDNNLNSAVTKLRAALHDSVVRPRFIETLPKRGYRFIGSISESAQDPKKEANHKSKIVVLPFLNLSGDPSQEYLADGITEEIISDLATFDPERLAVIARTTAMQYKKSDKAISLIGSELGVDYVVEGSVRPRQDRIVLVVQLIQVKDQTHLLARRYDTYSGEFPATAHQATHAVASQIGILSKPGTLSQSIRSNWRRSKATENQDAYLLYLRGRYSYNKGTSEGFATAMQFFENAIKQDPKFANAYCSMAEIYWYMGFMGLSYPKEAFSRGIWCAVRALEIDASLAEAHALLGAFRKVPDYNWHEVDREIQRALELNPESPYVRQRYAVSELMPLGRMEEAIEEMKHALELDPLSQWMRAWYAELLSMGRQYERGLQEITVLLEHVPTFWPAQLTVGHLYRDLHMYDKATAALRRANELSGEAPFILGWLGQALVNSGEIAEARAILKKLPVMASRIYIPPTSFAWIHLALGEIDSALSWLDKAIDDCDPMITPIKNYPFLDPLRDDPRFHALLRKMNLEP
jgi:TolB-like protein